MVSAFFVSDGESINQTRLHKVVNLKCMRYRMLRFVSIVSIHLTARASRSGFEYRELLENPSMRVQAQVDFSATL